MNNINKTVRELIIEVLRLPADIELDSFNSDTIPEWDSMGHMQIIIKLESVFSCEIPRNKIPLMTNEEGIIDEIKTLL